MVDRKKLLRMWAKLLLTTLVSMNSFTLGPISIHTNGHPTPPYLDMDEVLFKVLHSGRYYLVATLIPWHIAFVKDYEGAEIDFYDECTWPIASSIHHLPKNYEGGSRSTQTGQKRKTWFGRQQVQDNTPPTYTTRLSTSQLILHPSICSAQKQHSILIST